MDSTAMKIMLGIIKKVKHNTAKAKEKIIKQHEGQSAKERMEVYEHDIKMKQMMRKIK